MNKKLCIRVVSLLIAVGANLNCLGAPPLDPLYEGKHLSYWLGSYDPSKGPSPEWQKADKAVHQAGTNALPLLLQMLRGHDEALNYKGVRGFELLRADAKEAVPALITIFEQRVSAFSQERAAQALGLVGPAAKAAIPPLMRGTTNTDAEVRAASIGALSEIQAEPELVLPIFVKALSDSDYVVQMTAAGMLGLLRDKARSAVPALIEWRKTQGGKPQSEYTLAVADLALKRIALESF